MADLNLDVPRAVAHLERRLRAQVLGDLHRRGAVVGVSGGVDSSVVLALCARALGAHRVLALRLPDRDSSEESARLAQEVASQFSVESLTEDVGPTLEALGCYRRQVEAIQSIFPMYGEGWRCKLTLPSLRDQDRLNVFQLTVQSPAGMLSTKRLPTLEYRLLVAATNLKQRVRANVEYFHAERLGYAVVGTPNRVEYDQGFFVKHGDGAADLKPIAHLYKTQVYALAEYLGIPEAIRTRVPTTETYSLTQTQEEFYFALPFRELDACLWAHSRGVSAGEVARATGLTAEQVERAFRDIEAKRRTTRYLHAEPLLVEPIPEVAPCVDSPAA